jgi:hypothetical protein
MRRLILVAVVFGCAACGGSSTPASAPPPPPPTQAASSATPDEPAATPPAPESSPTPAASTAPEPAPPSSAPPKIDFPPHASVDEAMKAVPSGLPRLNMSTDTLQAPLLDLKRYDKCKVPRSTKVTMRVAVFDGAAVGVEVATKPKNVKMEGCLDGVVRGMSWDKVPSLNEVNVTF